MIRPATTDDIAALSALAKRTWSDAFGHSIGGEDEAAELEETRSELYFSASLQENIVLVAESNGALVGYVQFGDVHISEVDVQPGDQELQRIYVETGLQGQGIGRTLVTAALEHPRLATASRVFLQVWERNVRAIRLYESVGFSLIGSTTFTIGQGVTAEDLVMLLSRPAFVSPSL